MGAEEWRMYCVHWNTRKAKLLRKSLADSRPATGRNWKPVLSAGKRTQHSLKHKYILLKNLGYTLTNETLQENLLVVLFSSASFIH